MKVKMQFSHAFMVSPLAIKRIKECHHECVIEMLAAHVAATFIYKYIQHYSFITDRLPYQCNQAPSNYSFISDGRDFLARPLLPIYWGMWFRPARKEPFHGSRWKTKTGYHVIGKDINIYTFGRGRVFYVKIFHR